MKRIALFKKGAAVIDTDSPHHIDINGEKPQKMIEFSDKNLEKYFGKIKDIKEDKEKKVKVDKD